MELDVKYLNHIAKYSDDAARINSVFRSDLVQLDVLTLESGQYISPDVSPISDTVYWILEGEGVFEVSDEVLVLTKNTSVLVAMGERSGIINESDNRLMVLKIQAPAGL